MISNDEIECEILVRKLIESSLPLSTVLSSSSSLPLSTVLSSSSSPPSSSSSSPSSSSSSSSPSSSSSSLSSSRVQDFIAATLPSIRCRPCSSSTAAEAGARAFIQLTNNNSSSDGLEIVLCSNRLRKGEIEEALLHELVHYYDYTNNRVDFSSCEGLAYSEVRAAREAECKGYYIYPFEEWAKKKCVSYYASKSTCNMFPDKGSLCVTKVLDDAMKDLSPLRK